MWTETGLCAHLLLNCADQVSRTRGSVTKTKDWMRKILHFILPSLLFPSRKGAFVSALRALRASTHATAACMGAEKAPSWYLSICTILESYIHWWQRKVLRIVFPPPPPWKPLLPEELGPHLSNRTPRPKNGWGCTCKNGALNYHHEITHWDDLQHRRGEIFKRQQKKNWWYKLTVLNTFPLWVSRGVSPVFFPLCGQPPRGCYPFDRPVMESCWDVEEQSCALVPDKWQGQAAKEHDRHFYTASALSTFYFHPPDAACGLFFLHNPQPCNLPNKHQL